MNSDDADFGEIVVNQPSLSKDGPLSKKPWKYLTIFEVTCQGRQKVVCPIYANGRQQVPIQINIEARDEDGVIVDVNHSKLYLNLVSYDDVDVFPSDLGRAGNADSRFIYNWQVGPAEAANGPESSLVDIERGQSVMQFVSASKVGTYKLAARCRSPDWVLFTTNTTNPTDGKFDSWVLIDGRPPEAQKWDCFAMTRTDYREGGGWDIDLYYVYFTIPNLKIVASIKYGSAGDDEAHYSWIKSDRQTRHVAYPAGARRDVDHYSCESPGIGTVIQTNLREGQATVARIREPKPCGNFTYNGVVMGYIDQFGNESKVGIKGASDGNTLYLRDPNSKDDDPPEQDSDG